MFPCFFPSCLFAGLLVCRWICAPCFFCFEVTLCVQGGLGGSGWGVWSEKAGCALVVVACPCFSLPGRRLGREGLRGRPVAREFYWTAFLFEGIRIGVGISFSGFFCGCAEDEAGERLGGMPNLAEWENS